MSQVRTHVAAVAVPFALLAAMGCTNRSGSVDAAEAPHIRVSSTAASSTSEVVARPSTTDPLPAGATAVDTAGFTGSVALDASAVWVSHDSGTIDRLDAASGATLGALPVRNGSFAARPAFGFGSMWFTTDLDDTLWRVDASTGEVQGSLRIPGDVLDNAAMSFQPVAVTEEAVWVVSSDRSGSTLHRIDPASSTILGSMPAPLGANNVGYGFGSLWVTTRENMLVRVDATSGQQLATISLGKYARTLRFGLGSLWTQAVIDDVDTIVRIDPQTNAVVSTIRLHPAVDWNLWRVDFAFAGGSVWTCTSETPLVRIDPGSNEIVSRFGTQAGGCSVAASADAVWFVPYAGRQLFRLPLT